MRLDTPAAWCILTHMKECAVIALASFIFISGCAHRYSEDRRDWVGPQTGDFDSDFEACHKRMVDEPFRWGGDSRLLFLDCMRKRGWHLKGAS